MNNSKINSVFMNSKISKTSDLNRLLLNLTDKIFTNLYQILAFTIYGKHEKVT